MFLGKIKDGIKAVKSKEQSGLESICTDFLHSINSNIKSETLCSFVGGLDNNVKALMGKLNLDDFSNAIESLKTEK